MNESFFAQTDSSYKENYRSKIVPRITTDFKIQDISFSSKTSDSTYLKSNFSTGAQFQIGGAISYKWMNLGYAFSLSPNNSKQNIDLRFSTGYRRFQVQFNFSYLRNLNYTLIQGNYSGTQDTIISQREKEINIITSKLKVDYVFNYRKYSYSAGFSPTNRQLKSAGSFLASAAISNDRVSLSNLSMLVKPLFDSINGFDQVMINSVDLGGGYGYNWVINPHWTLSFIELPKIGLEFINASSSIPEKYFFTVGFVNHFKAGFVYRYNRFFSGFSAYNLISISKIKSTNYSNAYSAAGVYCGWVFDVRKKRLTNL
jgi:hypothetical protein